MDKNKHLKEPTREQLDELIMQDFDFDDIIGHRVEFIINGIKNIDSSWKIDAEAVFSMSLNGMDWVSATVPVTVLDEDYDSALATAMMGVAGGLNDRELLARIRFGLNQQNRVLGGIIEDMDGKLM